MHLIVPPLSGAKVKITQENSENIFSLAVLLHSKLMMVILSKPEEHLEPPG